MSKFSDVDRIDFFKMSLDEIINVVSNTFTSKVIQKDLTWTVIEIDWVCQPNSEIMKLSFSELIGKKYKVYLHIMSNDDDDQFLIIRSKDKDKLDNTANDIVSSVKGSYIQDYDSVDSKIIMFNDKVYTISFSSAPIPKYKDSVRIDGKSHLLHSMISYDVNIDRNEKLEYFSSLMIGSDIEVNENKYEEI